MALVAIIKVCYYNAEAAINNIQQNEHGYVPINIVYKQRWQKQLFNNKTTQVMRCIKGTWEPEKLCLITADVI